MRGTSVRRCFARSPRPSIAGTPTRLAGSFRGWLSRIARNLLVNFLTRRPYRLRGSGSTSVQELLEAQPADDPSATALFEAEYRRRLFRWAADEVKDEFAPKTWNAFWQTAVEGRSPGDVAAELGLSVGAVYIARSRALARLRHRIGQLGEEASAIVSEVEHGSPAETLVISTDCGCWPRIACHPTRSWDSKSTCSTVQRVARRWTIWPAARPGSRRSVTTSGTTRPRLTRRARPWISKSRSASSRRRTGPTRWAGSGAMRSRA